MRKTIKDIAEACGVSISLVSRIINNDKTLKCREETREKVLLEIERCVFIPDTHARALANTTVSAKNGIAVGYITYKGSVLQMNPYFDKIVEGIVSALEDADCSVHRFYIDEVAKACNRKMPLWEKKLDGLIVFGEIENDKLKKYLIGQTKYISSIYGDEIPNADFIGSDLFSSMDSMLDYIKDCGYTHIGLLHGGDKKRVDHVLAYARELGLQLDEGFTFNAGNQGAIAHDGVKQRIERGLPLPQVLCCMNDEMAISAMNACLESGLRVPQDIGITGHDDILRASYSQVPLTTVHIFKKEIGQLVTQLLLERIKSKRKFAVKMFIPHELHVRESILKLNEEEK